MADIALRTYLQQVDHHIEQKQFDEAISHCKHILTHYPKSIETYRLLGKALLEKGRHGDAADIFQRVLSAVPDDFVSHVGMAIVREDESNLEAALWHMERAFESSPANAAVQEELRRLYGRRDGVVPPRARLTRGGLARLYARGDLFSQAETELRVALAEDPERLDLRALLARVLAENGQRAEAADVAGNVLHKLPYNQEANRLLAGLLTAQNRADEARPYQQRLEALDPYDRFTDGPLAAPVRDDAVRVPLLAYDPDRQAAAAPDWAESLGADLESVTPAASADEPEWLRLGSDLLAVQTGALTTGTSALTGGLDEPLTGELPEPGEVPDWMRDVDVGPVSAPVAAELPDWMKATTGMMASPTAEAGEKPKKKTGQLTGWLNQEPAITAFGTTATPAGNEVPDWMKDIAPPPAASSEPSLTEVLGDWRPTAPMGDEGPTARLADDLPDWLKTGGLDVSTRRVDDAETTRPIGQDAPTEALEAGELPAWLKNIPSTGEVAPEKDVPAWLSPETPTNLDELPPWLAATGATAAAAGSAAADLPLPDWLENVPPSTPQAPPETIAPSQPPAAPAPVELPDFLQPASPEAIERASAPVDWGDTSTTPGEFAEAGEVPDWVKAMAPADSAPLTMPAADLPPIAEEEVPDWLRAATKVDEPPVDVPAAATEAVADLTASVVEEPAATLPAAEVPAWAEPTPPGASETIAGWLRSKDMPDWLREMRAKARDEGAAPAEQPPAEAPVARADLPAAEPTLPDWLGAAPGPAAAATAPDLSAMSEDEAMRWLEGLAARQGADPAELTTTAEERAAFVAPEAPVMAEPAGADSAVAEPVAAEPVAAEDMPDWLRAMGTPPTADLTPPVVEQPPAQPAAATAPDLSAMSEDDAMRWLEGLAARQGADPAELTTTAEERAAFVAPEAPVMAEPAGADSAVAEPVAAEPVAAEDMPDWLRAMGTPPTADLTPPVVEQPPAQPAAAVPDLGAMSEDEAMRWLEGLAVRQGADPAELTTTAEERAAFIAPPATEMVPEWPLPEEPAAAAPLFIEDAAELEEPARPLMPPTGTLPDIFGVNQAEQAEAPAAAAVPDFSTLSDDEAMRWLEGLAARQGADPAELTTRPEDRADRPPIWITAESETPLPAEAAEPPAAEADLPDWLRPSTDAQPSVAAVAPEPPVAAGPPAEPVSTPNIDEAEAMRWLESLAARPAPVAEELRSLVAEPEPPLVEEPAPEPIIEPPDWVKAPTETAPPATSTLGSDDRLSRLAERLSASRRAKETEVAERLERERAEREAAQREVQQRMEERRARRAETGTGTLRRQTEPLPSLPEAAPATPPLPAEPAPLARPTPQAAEQKPSRPAVSRQPAVRTPAGTRLTRSPRKSRRPAFPGQTHTAVFSEAQSELQSGEPAQAQTRFEHLIRSGHKLDEVIAELEAYTVRNPDSALYLRLLGDAYMHAGRLQKALDAYRDALVKM